VHESERCKSGVKPPHCKLVAAATTAAAASAATQAGGRFCGAAGRCGAEDGKLDAGFFAGALGAGDFLLSVDDDFLELGFAVVADVFVDGHARFLYVKFNYSKFMVLQGVLCTSPDQGESG
jgi:hypothetical protein